MADRVVDSIENLEKDHCVDIFVCDDGSFGFEEWRRVPEDPGNWSRARYYAAAVHASPDAARADARLKVEWHGALPDK